MADPSTSDNGFGGLYKHGETVTLNQDINGGKGCAGIIVCGGGDVTFTLYDGTSLTWPGTSPGQHILWHILQVTAATGVVLAGW